MKLFTTAVETPGVTLQSKVLEFQHYFEGAALQLIEADLMKPDQELGYAFAVSRLTQKFGKRKETALEQLDEILAGKPLPEKDAGALLEFWGKLASVHALAVETDRAGEFETRATKEVILRRKLPHLSVEWAKRVVKKRMNDEAEMKFVDFLDFINERHDFIDQLNRITGAGSAQAQQKNANGGVRVAATTAAPKALTAPAAAAPKSAAKPAPRSTGCIVCGTAHTMARCEKFRGLETGAKRTAIMNAGACFKCLESGHLARHCTAAMTCDVCQQNHHGAAHELQPKERIVEATAQA